MTKLYRAIRFESKAMLADYIQLNTTQRTAAGKGECKRNFFKLMNVAPYGKTIDNVAKRIPNTHAYGQYSLANEVRVQEAEEQAGAGNDLQIELRAKKEEARLQRKHALAIMRARSTQPEDISDDDEAEVQGDDLIQAQRASVARPQPSVRINTVIKRICARDYLERPSSPPLRMPQPPNPQRAGKVILLITIT